MHFAFISFLLLAGQALSLSIDVGGSVGTIDATQFLNVSDTYLLTDCQTQCSNANAQISTCTTNDSCLCASNTVTAITSCEQCMFDDLIAKFTTSADPRAGSTAALTAYATACSSAGFTVPSSLVTLSIPSNWDGPLGVSLSTASTVVIVAITAALGTGSLLLLSNL
ncbi:uncharacterized protein F5891DRAFT_1281629 [Suillus fuscotomentosus]|uniref:Extracellular membrane protein CFEM domain-containing protein n=2 Tax=Suillus TaxID=5379 RepID=A0A9P7F587_9AGAM|nr:uncharacterized protein F5891DRAFT_1281629 [Suillus fuscotomentosus]XP_041292409.1 uncharacterized protein F5147DRAFT_761197 [Suillus discolor]KAG1894446.1 hypothetical protein F5891DRAFT_1281629 [Suillus fuscotomentosus]KAG2107678.1 hypothetical protein F5147DRAFT_761197 [Suillus discolor]